MRILTTGIVAFFAVALSLLSGAPGSRIDASANPASKDGYMKAAPSNLPPSAAKPKSGEKTPTTARSFRSGVEREMKESGERGGTE